MRNTLIFFLISLLIIGCKDETTTTSTIHDPSKPVQITGFEPTEGGARTRLYIQGNNFGSNTDDIKVKIGGLPAKVIGSNGNIIYCMVPFKASEGTIEVSIKGQDPITAAEKFNYVSKTIVGTVAGYVDETGKVKVQDGSFKEAGFSGPGYMTVDPKDPNAIGISYTTRANGFKKPQPLVIGRKIVSVAVHPNGELYYVKRKTGELIRFDMQTKEEKVLYALGDGEPMFFIFMHPSGNYAYISFSQWKTILKIPYDWKSKTLLTASILCGQQKQEGWLDGQGTNAKLGNPAQGVFIKNEQYIKEGKDDIYDFYFTDSSIHCIRYVTPEGFVHTYAGRGSQGVNNNPNGYVDGDLRQEARFNYPFGIHYDEVNKIFYIGDIENYRIRNIAKDE